MKVERILFPTDFSECAAVAMDCAVDLAKRYNAKLHILHVVYDVTKATGSHIPHVSADEMYGEMNKWAQNEIDRCCTEGTRELEGVEKSVIEGVPYEAIIKFAEKENSDMIVIGTYGRSGLERFIFGSTAERVVRRAPCAVLTVRPKA